MSSSDTDSSEDDEHLKRLRESVAPSSCLPVAPKQNSNQKSELQNRNRNGTESLQTERKTAAGHSSLPSLRKEIYGDDDKVQFQDGLHLDQGARNRIAKTLHNSMASELQEGSFTLLANSAIEADTGVRLFRKAPLVCTDGEKKETREKPSITKKKRKVSSSDSDDSDDMAAIASVAVSGESIQINSLTAQKTESDEKTKPQNHDSQTSNQTNDTDCPKKKKKKKKKRKPESNVSEVT